jgi:hypothetical protein
MSRFALRLEQLGLFDWIDPSSSRETFDGSEAVSFHLDCWLLGAAPRKANAHAANDTTGVTP